MNNAIFLAALALVLYGNGAAFIESFVNYASWHLIGPAEFTTYHDFIRPRVLAFLVAPALLGTLFSVAMLWFRPPAIPRWSVWAAIGLQAIVWAPTALIQVPIQLPARRARAVARPDRSPDHDELLAAPHSLRAHGCALPVDGGAQPVRRAGVRGGARA